MRNRYSLPSTTTLAVLAVSLGCATSGNDETPSEDEISARNSAYVELRRDVRRCAAPRCGGYFITELNHEREERYVSALDFSQSGYDDATIADVNEAPPGELIIYGRLGPEEKQFGTRPLRVLEAFRGLPGEEPERGDLYYAVTAREPPQICITAPCNNLTTGSISAICRSINRTATTTTEPAFTRT
jgi:hypothetical protein